jgi:hypothetical protein
MDVGIRDRPRGRATARALTTAQFNHSRKIETKLGGARSWVDAVQLEPMV